MKINLEHIFQNKFNCLLMTQIVILLAYPILHKFDNLFPIISLMFLLAITPALWVGLSRGWFIVVISIGVFAFLLNMLLRYGNMEFKDTGILFLLFLYGLFYFLAIAILMVKISSNTTVSSDTIKGGISIYILLGFFWAILYMTLLFLDPDAISNISSTEETAGFECYYYSFTTLTTLGYGDIVPVAKYARILAMLEAIAGPVYLAIFVAQIIGMNIAQKMKS
ncbi:MAG: potassium channel family protein [Planctomycetota bacterium]